MKLGGVAPVILGFLSKRPKSGYDIKVAVDRSTRFFWAASYGQIYPELRRLEQAGLVRGESRPTGGRRRRVYEITPTGLAALREWLLEPGAGCELRDLGLLKIFFASALDEDEAIEVVREFRRSREQILETLRTVAATSGRLRGGFGDLVLEFGLGLNEWQAEWAASAERRLSAQKRKRGAG